MTNHSSPVTVLDHEEKYLLEHFNAECGIMPGDVEGSFHRIREALAPAQQPPSPVTETRPLTDTEVTALRHLADHGPMHCDCESSAELCHCSTIMMLCDEWKAIRRHAQCARADIAKAIAYDLENGSAHGARVVTTPHLDNYHVTGHVNLLALADAVLALSSTSSCTPLSAPGDAE